MRGGLGPQCRSPFCPVRSLCPTIPSIKYRPWCPHRAQRSGQGWLWGGGVGWAMGSHSCGDGEQLHSSEMHGLRHRSCR